MASPGKGGASGGSKGGARTAGLTGRAKVEAQIANTSDGKVMSAIKAAGKKAGDSTFIPVSAYRREMRAAGINSRKAQDALLDRMQRKDKIGLSSRIEPASKRATGKDYFPKPLSRGEEVTSYSNIIRY